MDCVRYCEPRAHQVQLVIKETSRQWSAIHSRIMMLGFSIQVSKVNFGSLVFVGKVRQLSE
jgi:hypothetical protein